MSPYPPSRPAVRHLPGGDRLLAPPGGETPTRIVESPAPKPGWNPRVPATAVHVPYPGTPLVVDEMLWEIVAMETRSGPPTVVAYRLEPWRDEFPVREPLRYDADVAEAQAAERRAKDAHRRASFWLFLAVPLIGLLPASDQRRVESEYGLLAVHSTFASAYPLFVFGVFGRLYWPLVAPLFFTFLFAESFFRIVAAWKGGTPIGEFFVAVPILVSRSLRRELSPEFRQKQFERMEGPVADPSVYLAARDELVESPARPDEILVTSILPKPDWGPQTGVRFRDAWWVAVDSSILRHGKRPAYRWVLRTVPDHLVFRTTVAYDPAEVRARWLEKHRRSLGTWVTTFPFVFGLLEAEEQIRLATLYDYEPDRWTRWSIGTLGAVSAISVAVSAINAAAGIAQPADLAWALGGLLLGLESLARGRALAADRITGSLLGVAVRPFWKRLVGEVAPDDAGTAG